MPKLKAKQEAFVREYLVDWNATQAAKRAGYRGNENSLAAAASRLLRNVNVAARIAELQGKRAERLDVTVDRIEAEFAKIAFANAGDFFEWGAGGIVVIEKSKLTRDQQAAVAEVSETTTESGGTIRVKLHDKIAALTKLGERHGMFKQVHEHGGKDGSPIAHAFNFAEIRDALRRAHGIGAGVPSGGNGHAGSNGVVRDEGSAASPPAHPPSGG